MTKLPRLTGKEVIDVLRNAGFKILRRKGTHNFLEQPDGRTTTVPVHRKDTIRPSLMSKILRDCEMTRDEFMGFRK